MDSPALTRGLIVAAQEMGRRHFRNRDGGTKTGVPVITEKLYGSQRMFNQQQSPSPPQGGG